MKGYKEKREITKALSAMSRKEIQDTLAGPLKRGLKNVLYDKSLLRNKFQVRPLSSDELSILKNKNKELTYYVHENGKHIVKNKSKTKRIYIPLFEISCYLQAPTKSVMKFSVEQATKILVDRFYKKFLKTENDFYYTMRKCRKSGKGIFFIRTDLQVLQATPTVKTDIGWSVFEHIAIAIC